MNCETIAQAMHFDCLRLNGLHGETVFELGTPFSLSDGSAIGLYVIDRENLIEINDNADTLMSISALGVDPWKSKRMGAIRHVIAPFGSTLSDDGALSVLAQPDRLAYYLPRFIAGQLAVGAWARERIGVADQVQTFADEVEIYLRAWRRQQSVTRNPEVMGLSGQRYQFDFSTGAEFVDAISPNANSTGSVMRKLGDVINSGLDAGFRVIVDDRTDPVRAQVELQIIGSLATAMPFSSLLHLVERGNA